MVSAFHRKVGECQLYFAFTNQSETVQCFQLARENSYLVAQKLCGPDFKDNHLLCQWISQYTYEALLLIDSVGVLKQTC